MAMGELDSKFDLVVAATAARLKPLRYKQAQHIS